MRGVAIWVVLGVLALGCDDAAEAVDAQVTGADAQGLADAAAGHDAVALDRGPAADAALPDAGPEADAEPEADAGPEPDATLEPDAAPGPDAALGPDAAPEPDAALEPDAAPEPDAALEPDAAPVDWPADRPEGQCQVGADCESGNCSADAPGGICLAPGCPERHVDSGFGACNRLCDDDQGCPVGLACTRGRCLVPRCDADADCEGPYVCADGLCNRPACGAGCPAPLMCRGARCVEPG